MGGAVGGLEAMSGATNGMLAPSWPLRLKNGSDSCFFP